MTPAAAFAAKYLDGRTAAEHAVQVTFSRVGLEILKEDGSSVTWPFHSLRYVSGGTKGQPLRIETREDLPQILIASPELLPAIRALWPGFARQSVVKSNVGLTLALLAVAAVLAGVALFRWGVPAASAAVARMIPASWEDRLGSAVASTMATASKRCEDEGLRRNIESIVDRLSRTVPDTYNYRIYVSQDEMVNAFAAPGGHIVVMTGLLRRTKSAEELAAVLAHEMQHVVQRHTTTNLVRGLGVSTLLAAIFGDVTGVIGIAATLGSLHYIRGDEDSADTGAVAMFEKARLDPRGIVRMLRMLEKATPELPGAVSYLSTHPATRDRIEKMEKFADAAKYSPTPLLPGVAWPPEMRCGGSRN